MKIAQTKADRIARLLRPFVSAGALRRVLAFLSPWIVDDRPGAKLDALLTDLGHVRPDASRFDGRGDAVRLQRQRIAAVTAMLRAEAQ